MRTPTAKRTLRERSLSVGDEAEWLHEVCNYVVPGKLTSTTSLVRITGVGESSVVVRRKGGGEFLVRPVNLRRPTQLTP